MQLHCIVWNAFKTSACLISLEKLCRNNMALAEVSRLWLLSSYLCQEDYAAVIPTSYLYFHLSVGISTALLKKLQNNLTKIFKNSETWPIWHILAKVCNLQLNIIAW